MLDAVLRAYMQVHGKKNAAPPKPIEIPRPWKRGAKPARSGTSLGELMRASGLPVRHSAKEVTNGGKP